MRGPAWWAMVGQRSYHGWLALGYTPRQAASRAEEHMRKLAGLQELQAERSRSMLREIGVGTIAMLAYRHFVAPGVRKGVAS